MGTALDLFIVKSLEIAKPLKQVGASIAYGRTSGFKDSLLIMEQKVKEGNNNTFYKENHTIILYLLSLRI